jgi:hypothetical protein
MSQSSGNCAGLVSTDQPTMTAIHSKSDVPQAPAQEYERHLKDVNDQQSSYMAMESTSNAVELSSQAVQSTSDHEEYVSLNISRDSDEDRKKSVYHKTTEVGKESDIVGKRIINFLTPSTLLICLHSNLPRHTLPLCRKRQLSLRQLRIFVCQDRYQNQDCETLNKL